LVEQGKPSAKVSPEVVQTILLDEISGRLADLKNSLPHAGVGIMVPMTITVISAIQELTCKPEWYGVTVFNDGPNPVYMDVNRTYNAVNFTTPLNPGEHLNFDYDQPVIVRLYFQCLAAQSTSVRLFARY
jgi:hypothetical protein